MNIQKRLPVPRNHISLDFFRHRLAHVEALPQLAILGVGAGVITGLVTVVFRAMIEFVATILLERDSENFESLPLPLQIALPILGALAIGLILTRLTADDRRTGVVHVMERLGWHHGLMPLKNVLVQFFGGVAALSAGLSGGREGPAIHLGAATSSILGQALRLPNNSVRLLIACGTAAAIAGSFNTPMAGVIFAMEVIMMEYTIAGFIPVILAAVTSTVVSRFVFGDVTIFTVPSFEMASLWDLPFVVFTGLVIGALAATFIVTVRSFAKLNHWPFWLRSVLAGTITAGAALAAPAVMGVGYDTINQALAGELFWPTLLIIIVGKTLASAACVGMGLPVGLIAPVLVIGAVCGGVLGHLGNFLSPAASSEALYVILGMTAMMAATLHAPLAALATVLELTANPNIILPAMLIIVISITTSRHVFRQRSVFLTTLSTLGLKYPLDPVSQYLSRAGVASIMQTQFMQLSELADTDEVNEMIAQRPQWIVIEDENGAVSSLLELTGLDSHLETLDHTEFALMDLTADRKTAELIDIRATIYEAYEQLKHADVEAGCVYQAVAPAVTVVIGIVTRASIEEYFRQGDC